MKTLILDGSRSGDPLAVRINAALRAHLPEAETIVLREKRIGNCAGDFFCWVRNPGICNVDDDNRIIAAKTVQSDLLVCLTPVTFGGYSSALKRMVDHQIQNILPFFTRIDGEIHHQKRYKRYPNVLAIGWMEAPAPHAEAVFRHLVHRNAVNMHSKTAVCGLVIGDSPEAELKAQTGLWLEAIARGSNSAVPGLPATDSLPADAEPVRRAVLLVGSPRTKKSTSASLGGYLMARLAARGIATETVQIYTSFNSPERTRAALERLAAADLVVLAFPLYVDSLPAPVIAALEEIAAHRAGTAGRKRFAAIANCGFPEAAHNATALAICSEFARQSGFAWAGGLALGGGEGLVHGVPLDELDGQAIPIRKALGLAAAALADGSPSVLGGNRGRPPLAPAYPAWITDPERAGGGALMDHSVHVTDAMRFILDSEVETVFAESGTLFQPGLRVDDGAQILLKFRNGVAASVDPSWSIPSGHPYHYDFFLRILGEHGLITLDDTRQALRVSRDLAPSGPPADRAARLEPFGVDVDAEMVRHFLRCLRQGEESPPRASGEDGVRALEIALAAYESARRGQPVPLPLAG